MTKHQPAGRPKPCRSGILLRDGPQMGPVGDACRGSDLHRPTPFDAGGLRSWGQRGSRRAAGSASAATPGGGLFAELDVPAEAGQVLVAGFGLELGGGAAVDGKVLEAECRSWWSVQPFCDAVGLR